MPEWNQTSSSVKEFLIIGFPGFRDQESRRTLFAIFLTVYLFILVGNILLVLIFMSDKSLHTPMYILVCGLACLDVVITTNIIPSMLVLFTVENRFVSLAVCFTQMTFWVGLFATESFLLALMAYDRYIAISNPLHYPQLMSNTHVSKLMAFCLFTGFLCALVCMFLLLNLSFCTSNIIINCFCDFASVLFLACSVNVITNYLASFIGVGVTFIPLLFILFTYVWIIRSVVKIASRQGRRKAFYTCGSHILVISIFFLGKIISDRIPITFIDTHIMGLVVQSVFPALTNPIIYCLRTKEIRASVVKTLKKF